MATDKIDESLGKSGVAPGGYYGSRMPHFPEPTDRAATSDYNPFDNPGFGGFYGDFYGRGYRYDPPGDRQVGPFGPDDHLGYGPFGGREEPLQREDAHFAGVGPVGYRRSDDRIGLELHDLLAGHPDLDASDIELKVEDGIVDLRGFVPDREQKWLAEDLAYEVMGVRDIVNRLKPRRRP